VNAAKVITRAGPGPVLPVGRDPDSADEHRPDRDLRRQRHRHQPVRHQRARPVRPLYLPGARLLDAIPVAPQVAGVRLSVTALSYDGVLPITLLANQAITGPPSMAAGMRSALGPPTRGNHAGPGFPALKTSCPD
jgi:hypothetical protein